jgi:hypothetical protein
MTLQVNEFKHILDIGLGRAILALQQMDAAPYQVIILNACLHHTAFDAQINTRAEYMFDVVKATGNEAYYRDRILEAVKHHQSDPDAEYEDYDVPHTFDLARLFAADGDSLARQTIYDVFLSGLSKDTSNLTGAATIVKLDGIEGLVFVGTKLGELALADTTFEDDDQLLHLAEENSDKETVAKALEQAIATNPQLAAYISIVRKYEAEHEANRKNRKRQHPSTVSYEALKQHIENPRDGLYISGHTWGEYASPEDLTQAAIDLQKQTDPKKLVKYIQIFHAAPFPLDPNILFIRAQHADERVAVNAISALENMSHPAVRSFALKSIEQGFFVGHAVGLLTNNFQDGDWQLIEDIAKRDLEEENYHILGISVRDVFERHPEPSSAQTLLYLYENGPCSMCRYGIVKCLYQINAVPEWMAQECRYDADTYLRDMARKNFDGFLNSSFQLIVSGCNTINGSKFPAASV